MNIVKKIVHYGYEKYMLEVLCGFGLQVTWVFISTMKYLSFFIFKQISRMVFFMNFITLPIVQSNNKLSRVFENIRKNISFFSNRPIIISMTR